MSHFKLSPPKRIQLPSLGPTPPKPAFLTFQSTSTLPNPSFAHSFTDDIFSHLNNAYLNKLASQSLKSTAPRTPAKPPIAPSPTPTPCCLNLSSLLPPRSPSPTSPFPSFPSHFRKTGTHSFKTTFSRPAKSLPSRDDPDKIKMANMKRMIDYKMEKLDMCSRELEMIIEQTKKKVTRYGREKVTLDIGGL